jgi:hypothetical protein
MKRTTTENMKSHTFRVSPRAYYRKIHSQEEAENAIETICDLLYELIRLPDLTHEADHVAGEMFKLAKAVRRWINNQKTL